MSEKVESTGMDLLKEVANVSGKGGLFRILKPSRAGVIVESLDEKREKTLIGPTARVSVLKDVSIFTDGAEESVALSDVFLKIREIHGEEVTLAVKTSSDKELIEFLAKVLPDFDRTKVYVSDIKKVITWYNLLSKYIPEAFVASEAAVETEVAAEEEVAEEPVKKSTKKEKSKA
ncbi:DUF5606 family protein [Dyadobacter sp. MSC1_007]|jgi:hypothetical protein|uniref:DUF5606 family protein n=1 Tax=Dyadobacter sp. MSC1_007 TaxID=2909264 RepID=UPI00202EFCFD|nr:DUF5606 domain-containing protein [Dyadobacter sp. MSC1_007]